MVIKSISIPAKEDDVNYSIEFVAYPNRNIVELHLDGKHSNIDLEICPREFMLLVEELETMKKVLENTNLI